MTDLRPPGCGHIDPTGWDRECWCPDADELEAWLAEQADLDDAEEQE